MAEDNAFEGFPDWFDAAAHHAAPGGIYETASNVLLGEDGQPASAAVRAQRAAEAEAEASPPAKKGRDTRSIIEGHAKAVAAADKE